MHVFDAAVQDLLKLLAVGGVLAGPIGDQFVKITRLSSEPVSSEGIIASTDY